MLNKILEVKNLEVGYFENKKKIDILRGIDFNIFERKQFGIAGESGSGKTTIALSILKLLKPNTKIFRGEIFYKGKDVLRMDEEEILKLRGGEIGIVFQNPFSSLNPVMKIGKQIEEVITEHKTNLSVEELLLRVNLKNVNEIKNSYPHQLSGGMLQRVMLAIALGGRPSLLIADEPTTSLDKTLEKEIIELLKNLIEKENLTLIFISHNLGLIKFLTTHILVMYAGIVLEEGRTEDVLKEPLHPYTKALVESYPKKGKKFISIPGSPPDITKLPSGCKFHPRCKYAREECKKKEPELFELNRRKVRCFLVKCYY